MPVPNNLAHFRTSEFKKPELVNDKAARYLDVLRALFNKPIILTDDARVKGEALPPGASGNSLHYLGQAFDIRIRHWTKEELWNFVRATCELDQEHILFKEGGIELELVWSSTDKHAHIGFFLDGRPSRLIVRGE